MFSIIFVRSAQARRRVTHANFTGGQNRGRAPLNRDVHKTVI